MNLHWLLWSKRWVRNPPSMQRVMLGAVVLLLCLGIVLVEAMGLWPAALTAAKARPPSLITAP